MSLERSFWEFCFDTYCWYKHVDNWHTQPLISKIMCKMGRHDYELKSYINIKYAALYCFYCEKVKHSSAIEGIPSRTF